MTEFRLPRMYAIVDAAQTNSPATAAAPLLAAGVRLIQYRDKGSNAREIHSMSMRIAPEIARAGGIFIVNDRADIALAACAEGVHLGQEDLPARLARRCLPPGKIIGLSTHTIAQVEEADREPVDYIAFGPIFQTQSKVNPDPAVGLEGIEEARKMTLKPLVAIGGITLENARSVIRAGADSVAVIRDLLSAPDVCEQAQRFLRILGE